MYIAEIIDEKEIDRWLIDDRILISSPTGTGKTSFIFTIFYQYCKKENKRILLLSNRTALKEQNNYIFEKKLCSPEYLSLKNYQSVENEILEYDNLDTIFANYDFIVFDECHYFFSDSFNKKSDILINYLHPNATGKIYIFITATPEPIFEIQKSFDRVYTIPEDFSFINQISFYSSDNSLDEIYSKIPLGEKSIYLGKIKKAYKYSNKIGDSSFICSANNKDYKEYRNLSTIDEIKKYNKFSCQHLFCTQVLDNGISLIDSELINIIIDQVNIVTFVQFLGRKRIVDGEKINLFVKNYTNQQLNGYFSQTTNQIEDVAELRRLGKDEFLTQYKRNNFEDIIFNDGTINEAKYANIIYQRKILQAMIKEEYDKYICNRLNINYNESKNIENIKTNQLLGKLLEDYSGKDLNKNEREVFVNLFFNNEISTNNHDYRCKGLKVIREILSEINLGYELLTERKTVKSKRETYWKVMKTG